MKRNLTLSLAAIFLLLIASAPIPVDDLLQRIYEQFQRYHSEQPYEKAYLHFDKDNYAAGDDIWFRAYLVHGIDHRPSTISRILYVEFLDPEGEVLSQLRLRADEGEAVGDFHLSDSLITGEYRIRAYTHWMINQGPEYFFEREFPIANARLESVSLQADYGWKQVKGGDSLYVTLHMVDMEHQIDGFWDVDYVLKSGSQVIERADVRLDHARQNTLRFYLPEKDQDADKLFSLEVETALGGEVLRDVILMGQKPFCAGLQFFPEGGDLVAGIESRVAFKAVDQYGKGFDIAGAVLLDSDHQQVTTFASRRLGMGAFQLKPEPGKTYYARVEIRPGGGIREFSLPAPMQQGYAMAVGTASPEKLELRISRTKDMPGELVLAAQVRGDMPFVIKAESPRESYVIPVPRSLFGPGLIHFTLFDMQGRPQAERLAYNPGPEYPVLMLAENDSFGYRERVDVLIQVQDPTERPIPASLSVSVVNQTVQPRPDDHYPDHIRSWLWLGSDLKGTIEQPAYYFDPGNPDASQALDELLLTQGWRRFSWKDLLAGEFPATPHLIERDLFISGKVLRMFGKPARTGSVQLSMFQDSGFVHIEGKTDEAGRFYFQEDFFGDRMAVLQGQTKTGNHAFQFELDPIPSAPQPPRRAALPTPGRFDLLMMAFLENSFRRGEVERAYQLATGEYLYELEPIMIRASANHAETRLLGQNYSDHRVTADDLDFYRYPNIFEVIRSRFPGVLISQDVTGNYAVLIRGFRSITGNNFALIVIDGVPTDAAAAASLFPGDIESIEVIKGPKAAIYGLRGGNGVVVITTKKGDNDKQDDNWSPGVTSFLARGYYAHRTFYSPKYDLEKPEYALPDLRATVHWEPVIHTDEQGLARFSFYTTDQRGDYYITLQGLAADGIPLTGQQMIRVGE